jgi:hypothetical protein
MNYRMIIIITAASLSLTLSACAPARANTAMMDTPTAAMMHETPTTDTMMHDTPTTDTMMHETPTTDAMMDTPTADTMMHDTPTADAMMESPTWFGASLTDVNSGKIISINDFKGKVVLVETMAQSCPICMKQELQVKSLLENLAMPADLVTLTLDIDPGENAEGLKAYAASNNFGWLYAIAPAEVTREIGKLYGEGFLTPASAPILIIDKEGKAHPLPFGIKKADDLLKAVQPYLTGM